MAKVKTKYGSMNEEKAATMFLTKVENIGTLVKPPSNEPKQYKPVDLILDDRMWPIIAPVLKVKDQPDDAELDFKKVAVWFNAQVAGIGSSDGMPIKELSAGETRKALMTATRKRYADASKELATVVSDAAKELAAAKNDEAMAKVKAKWDMAKAKAKSKLDEAKDILKRQGWTTKVVKRSGKLLAPGNNDAGVRQDSDKKGVGKGKASAGDKPKQNAGPSTMPTGIDKPEVGSPQTQAPVETASKAKPVAEVNATDTQAMTSTSTKAGPNSEKLYVSGDSYSVKAKLKEMGAKFDSENKQWWFADAESLAKGQTLIDSNTNTAKGIKTKK